MTIPTRPAAKETQNIWAFSPRSRKGRAFIAVLALVFAIELLQDARTGNNLVRFLESPRIVPERNTVGIPRNVSVAIIGDSISRSQYLSLVHYLHFGQWIDPEEHPSFVHRKDFESWNHFFEETNVALAPNELCDCIRDDTTRDESRTDQVVEIEKDILDENLSWKLNVIESYDNRYYHDPELNNTVYYIQSLGHFPTRGHYDAEEVSSLFLESNHRPSFTDGKEPPKWEWDMAGTIEHHLARLNPKPEYAVVNAGHWTHDFDDEKERFKVAYALGKAKITGIYRTTSKKIDETDSGIPLYEKYFCRILQNCLDVSWTGPEVGKDMYVDKIHFDAPIYQRFNMQLFDLLGVVHD